MRLGRPYIRHGTPASHRAGVVTTELAVTSPLLLLLAFATADFGRICHYDEVLSNAARTGAETGASQSFTTFTGSSWEADIREAVLDEMESLPDFDEADLEYSLSTSADVDGLSRVILTISYPFRTAVSWPLLPAEVPLRERFEMRQFR